MKQDRQQFRVAISTSSDEPIIELFGGKHFHLDADAIQIQLAGILSPRMIDLLRIASAVYVTDRIIRRVRNGSVGWSRTLRLEIDVLEPAFWKSLSISELLSELLAFLTGDDWELVFRDDPSRPLPPEQTWLPFSAPTNVCLYSGGLDSAAGVASDLRKFPQARLLPITVWHQSGQRHLVLKQVRSLSRHYKAIVNPLIVKFSMLSPSRLRQEENTQRSRSFLFCAVGGAAASLTKVGVVDIEESGIGAINLPLMAGMVSAKATRSTHPCFLNILSKLLTAVADQKIEFRLPHLQLTKGEVVAELTHAGLTDVALATASCVHYPLRDERQKQCGVCPACIFRRQALIAAGIDEPTGTYKYDLFSLDSADVIPASKLEYLRAFLMQIEKLSGIRSGSDLPPFLRRHLLGTHVVSPQEPVFWCVELYRRYVNEWFRVIETAQARGLAWAAMIRRGAAA
jgi:7-cyano-7-deazaguanine synthase in queuosine biosynthesis